MEFPFDIPADGVIARVRASAGRRFFGCGTLLALGALLVLFGFTRAETGLGYRLFLVLGGAGVLAAATIMWRSTLIAVELTVEGLRDTTGRVLAPLDDIVGVDRGVFAFKPSNGFMVRRKTAGLKGWCPGIWWATSKMLGVGGVTPAGEAKFMAESLSMLIAARDAGNLPRG